MYKRWENWASAFEEVKVLPADPFYVSLFAIYVAQHSNSTSVIKTVVPAIAWGHRLEGLIFATDCILLKDCINGLRRSLSKPRIPKDIVEIQHVKDIIDGVDYSDLKDLRTVCLIVLAFFGFLRFNELVALKRSDFTFSGSHMKILIRQSKTDQLRAGNAILISVLSKYCPVSLMHIYFIMAKIPTDSEYYVFRNIMGKGRETKLRPKNEHMTYTRIREIVLEKFKSIGLETKKLGLHSLRAGGATAAARQGVSDRLFQRHGRWASEGCKNLYIQDDLESMLSVTKNLGFE